MTKANIICDCCKKELAVVKDFREKGDVLLTYFVCQKCFNLDDQDFFDKIKGFLFIGGLKNA